MGRFDSFILESWYLLFRYCNVHWLKIYICSYLPDWMNILGKCCWSKMRSVQSRVRATFSKYCTYCIIRTDCFVNYLIFIFPLVCLIFSHLLKVLPFLCVVVSLQGRYSKMPDCACHPIRILHFIGFWTRGK